MRLSRSILATMLVSGGLLVGSASAASSVSSYRVTPHLSGAAASAVYHQILRTQNQLTRAYADAERTSPLVDEVKSARSNLNQTRRDYAAAVRAMRTQLANDPVIGPLQADVREIQQRLDAQDDFTVRMGIASELMTARNKLNAAEMSVQSVDPDLAAAKARVDEAMDALTTIQARQQQMVQQDATVVAIRQQLDGLHQQLSPH